MLAVNDVGEPDEGEPHVRFDGRELEQEPNGHRATGSGPAKPPRQLPTQPTSFYLLEFTSDR
jgi:hypothetical protein